MMVKRYNAKIEPRGDALFFFETFFCTLGKRLGLYQKRAVCTMTIRFPGSLGLILFPRYLTIFNMAAEVGSFPSQAFAPYRSYETRGKFYQTTLEVEAIIPSIFFFWYGLLLL